MLRLNHALPLALLMSVSVFAMEDNACIFKTNDKGEVIKDKDGKVTLVKEATVAKPAMALTWAKQEDGKFIATESTEVSKPLTQADRPVDLLSTIVMSETYTREQSAFNKLQQEKDAAIQAEAKQLDKLKAMATDLSRKLTAKQAAETGSNLNVRNLEKEMAKLQALKEVEISVQKQTVSDIELLKKSIAQTAQDVAAAEAAKKAAEAANKKGWSFGFGWGKSTPAPVAPVVPAAAEAAATLSVAETTTK